MIIPEVTIIEDKTIDAGATLEQMLQTMKVQALHRDQAYEGKDSLKKLPSYVNFLTGVTPPPPPSETKEILIKINQVILDLKHFENWVYNCFYILCIS